MILLIVLVVLVLFYFFLAYMAAKSWRITDVLLLVAVFLASIGFMVLAAMTLKTQAGWREAHKKLGENLARTNERIEQLTGVFVDAEELTVPAAEAELGRLLVDRGRLWRGVQLAQLGEGTFTIDMSRWGDSRCAKVGLDDPDDLQPLPADPADPAAATPAAIPHQIVANMTLRAFLEVSISSLDETQRTILFGDSELPALDTQGVCTIPAYYLGHFRVTDVADQLITLRPLENIDQNQLDAMQTGWWALYESMPVDNHQSLAGRTVEELRALFPVPAGELAQQRLEESLVDFARDQTPARDDDPPERTWTKVKFIKDHSIVVDVEEAQPGLGGTRFDFQGRALAADLIQGKPTEFKTGDIVLFDAATASGLERDGFCELVDEPSIYYRDLRDYSLIFHENNVQIVDTVQETEFLRKSIESVISAANGVREQIAYRQAEIQKLREEAKQYNVELAAVGQVLRQLQDQRAAQRQALSHLYRSNKQLHDQLTGRSRVGRSPSQQMARTR